MRFWSHSLPSPSGAAQSEASHVVQVSSLSFFFYSALRASVALRATCRAPAKICLAVIDFQNGEQQSRPGSDKKRTNRLQLTHKDPAGLINRAKRQVETFFKVSL